MASANCLNFLALSDTIPDHPLFWLSHGLHPAPLCKGCVLCLLRPTSPHFSVRCHLLSLSSLSSRMGAWLCVSVTRAAVATFTLCSAHLQLSAASSSEPCWFFTGSDQNLWYWFNTCSVFWLFLSCSLAKHLIYLCINSDGFYILWEKNIPGKKLCAQRLMGRLQHSQLWGGWSVAISEPGCCILSDIQPTT